MRRRWLVAASLLGFGVVVACRPATTTSTSTTAATSSSSSSSSCAQCHTQQAAEWSASMHRQAFTSVDFQRSFKTEPKQFCVDCHAPTQREAGVGCADCHSAGVTHATSPSKKNVTTKSCESSCHDFDAPGTHAILQSTAREKAMGPFAQLPCTSCHMGSAEKKKKDHRFNVTRNAEVLRRALDVSSARIDETRSLIVVGVATKGVGHRFPTGDIYRRLTITLTAYDQSDTLVGGDTFYLHRDWDRHRLHLQPQNREQSEPIVEDSRLSHVPSDFSITYRGAVRPARVHMTITYERGASAEGTFFEAFGTPLEIFDRDL